MSDPTIDDLRRRVAELTDQRGALLDLKRDAEDCLILEGLPEYQVRGQLLDVAIGTLLKMKGNG